MTLFIRDNNDHWYTEGNSCLIRLPVLELDRPAVWGAVVQKSITDKYFIFLHSFSQWFAFLVLLLRTVFISLLQLDFWNPSFLRTFQLAHMLPTSRNTIASALSEQLLMFSLAIDLLLYWLPLFWKTSSPSSLFSLESPTADRIFHTSLAPASGERAAKTHIVYEEFPLSQTELLQIWTRSFATTLFVNVYLVNVCSVNMCKANV